MRRLKFRVRAWLQRRGWWNRFECWRLRRRFTRGVLHEPEFACFRHLVDQIDLFLDVGANLGQSALAFRPFVPNARILSFEPNRALEFGLRQTQQLLGPGFEYRLQALGTESTTRRIFVPVVLGVPFYQFGALNERDLHSSDDVRLLLEHVTGQRGFDVVSSEIDVVRGDDLNLAPGAVKIDVEGSELDVLLGLQETIARHRPIVMAEGGACPTFLAEHDYARYRGVAGRLRPIAAGDAPLNSFFVPVERTADWRRAGLIQP